MQREFKRSRPHPAEAMSEIVFEVCCRTLGALRLPFQFNPGSIEVEPDSEYRKEWKDITETPGLFLQGLELEHPIDQVEWDMLLGNMNRPNWNDRHHHELAVRHQTELLRTARFHPQCLLSVAVQLAGELVPDNHTLCRESPAEAARPFPLSKVLEWLATMDLIEESEAAYQAKAECFQSTPRLRRSSLGLEVIRKVADWVTGPLGPPASHLHFHLLDITRKPVCAREILLIQGLSASPETHLAVLDVLPFWSKGRRRILQDMILARWIRSMEVFGGSPGFKAKSAACQVLRWSRICQYIKHIPSIQRHPRGSSAGFV